MHHIKNTTPLDCCTYFLNLYYQSFEHGGRAKISGGRTASALPLKFSEVINLWKTCHISRDFFYA